MASNFWPVKVTGLVAAVLHKLCVPLRRLCSEPASQPTDIWPTGSGQSSIDGLNPILSIAPATNETRYAQVLRLVDATTLSKRECYFLVRSNVVW